MVVKYSTPLKEAVEMFYAQDAEKLLRKVNGRTACGRCIVNCIARYLWCLIQQRGLAADVDVDYKLDCKSEDPKRIRLEVCRFCSCAECLMYAFVNGRIRCREPKEIVGTRPLEIAYSLHFERFWGLGGYGWARQEGRLF